jgi:hypothetical protein
LSLNVYAGFSPGELLRRVCSGIRKGFHGSRDLAPTLAGREGPQQHEVGWFFCKPKLDGDTGRGKGLVRPKRRIMPVIAMRTLFVGKPCQKSVAMLTRMGRRGWGSYSADNLKEARPLIEGGGFDLVLALQELPDGSGYELLSPLAERGSSLFVGIDLFHDRLWIPVVELGERMFGDRAIPADTAEAAWEQILLAAADNGNKDKRWRRAWNAAPASANLEYAPIQISLGPVCGADGGPPIEPQKARISSIALLQLRCSGFGHLLAGKNSHEAKRFDKTLPPMAAARKIGSARSSSGMHSRGRRD